MLKLSNPTILILVMGACLLAPAAASGDLVRVDITTQIFNGSVCSSNGGVYGEECTTNSNYFECGAAGDFDLLDEEDTDNICDNDPSGPDPIWGSTNGVGKSDVSGGGRWIFATTGGDPPEGADRTVALNFSDQALTIPGNCSLLAGLNLGTELGGNACDCTNPAGSLCFVQARMSADRAFKKGATRQAFSITVIKQETGGAQYWRPAANINYINPLYICDERDMVPDKFSSKDMRILQTEPCGGGTSVAEAEVCVGGDPNCSDNLGRWNLPVQIWLQKVPRPGDGGGGDPPGGCTTLGDTGDPCTKGNQCCSGKCTGKPKTCK